jgi:hypothetical protein
MDHIEIDFPVDPFQSVPRLLLRSATLFGSNLPFIAGVTLLVFLPATLALQYLYSLLNVPTDGILSYILMTAGDLVLAALAVPAILYGLTFKMRRGSLPPLAESLAWGRRQWGKTLWNSFKMEVSILLASLLLLIPGIITAIDLIFTETIVAVEADLTTDVRTRTRGLAKGRRWKIFFAMLPLSLLTLAGSALILKLLNGAANSRVLQAVADSLLAVVSQLTTVAVLLIYLGIIEPKPKAAGPRTPSRRDPREPSRRRA